MIFSAKSVIVSLGELLFNKNKRSGRFVYPLSNSHAIDNPETASELALLQSYGPDVDPGTTSFSSRKKWLHICYAT